MPTSSAAASQGRWKIILPVLRELGLRQVSLYALYQLGLRTGHYRRACDPDEAMREAQGMPLENIRPLWRLPDRDDLKTMLGEAGQAQLLAQADEIVAGQVRLFGGPPAPLRLVLSNPLEDWTAYEGGHGPAGHGTGGDIKWAWEPGRLGWAYTLGRAYLLSRDERYTAAFWRFSETFLDANPPYQGPHWASAQEVALRLIALTFGWQVFGRAEGEDAQRAGRLARAVAVHAARISPTLAYARAQNNNHLLSEASGLYTAGLFLLDHPQAQHWRSLGWRWFNYGLQAQIAPDGMYVQHSTNYHRLMLQMALWVNHLAESQGQSLPGETRERLAAATRWLLALLDHASGGVPNLGPNDGAYILPLTVCPQDDYRPVLQAASDAFSGERVFAPGVWDEMGCWLGRRRTSSDTNGLPDWRRPGTGQTPHVLRSPDGASWAYLRAARFTGRPGHADQMHLDLWWRGLNVVQDAGTYSYNAPPPWDNALAGSGVHNTVIVDGQDQMRRAGRFLDVDWAQAEVVEEDQAKDGSLRFISARHDGYRHLGLWHQRDVSVGATGDWEIIDTINAIKPSRSDQPHTACLHWLLPDWPWEAAVGSESSEYAITLEAPEGSVQLSLYQNMAADHPVSQALQIARAGDRVWGDGPVSPTWGWSSPTYGSKVPALSVRFTLTGTLPLCFKSKFAFPLGFDQEDR